jgi:hypothetical protein
MGDSQTAQYVTSTLVILAPALTALATIITVIKNNLGIRTEIVKRLDKVQESQNLVTRDIARLTMHDEHLPIEERLAAGDRYLKSGGNGASEVYFSSLVETYKKKLKDQDASPSV